MAPKTRSGRPKSKPIIATARIRAELLWEDTSCMLSATASVQEKERKKELKVKKG